MDEKRRNAASKLFLFFNIKAWDMYFEKQISKMNNLLKNCGFKFQI